MINGGGDVLSTLPDGVGEMRAVLADASLDDNPKRSGRQPLQCASAIAPGGDMERWARGNAVLNGPIESRPVGSRLSPAVEFGNQRHWLRRMPNVRASRYCVPPHSLPEPHPGSQAMAK